MTNTSLVKKTVATNNTQISTVAEVQQKVLKEANEKFLGVYKEIREELTREEQDIIRSRYKIGELVENMRTDEQTYGAKCVERMETVIGTDRSVIYQSLLFVQRYDKDQIEELLTLTSASGQPLLWTHICHLVRVPDKKIRDNLTQVILDGDLSPTEFLNYIQKKQGRGLGRQSRAGKPLARPKSLKGFVDQQYTMVEQLLRRKSKVWAGSEKPGDKSFLDILADTPLERIDGSFLTDLEQLQQLYEKASAEMDNMAEELLIRRSEIEQAKAEAEEKLTKDVLATDEEINSETLEVTETIESEAPEAIETIPTDPLFIDEETVSPFRKQIEAETMSEIDEFGEEDDQPKPEPEVDIQPMPRIVRRPEIGMKW